MTTLSGTFVYPGSFDPVTEGHMDIIKRASPLCDKLVVAVFENDTKRNIFSVDERLDMLRIATREFDNVVVDSFSGLTAEYMRIYGYRTLVRGLRAVSDFDYELQIALFNKSVNPDLDTLFLLANQEHLFLSSSLVRDMARHHADLTGFVPESIRETVVAKYRGN